MTNELTKKRGLKVMLLTAVIAFLSISITSCGPDDSPTTGDDGNNNGDTEYLIIDGVRYEGKDFYKKSVGRTNRDSILNIEVGPNYPTLVIDHEKVEADIPLRKYLISSGGVHWPDLDIYEVGFYFAYGSQPRYCQYQGPSEGVESGGTYEIKKVDGKFVSVFSGAKVVCKSPNGDEKDVIVLEGRIIWEDKKP